MNDFPMEVFKKPILEHGNNDLRTFSSGLKI